MEDIEDNGKEALDLLFRRHMLPVVLLISMCSHKHNSVHAIPRHSKFTGSEYDASLETLSTLGLQIVTRWHEKKLQVSNHRRALFKVSLVFYRILM
jgi:hypothetical protein